MGRLWCFLFWCQSVVFLALFSVFLFFSLLSHPNKPYLKPLFNFSLFLMAMRSLDNLGGICATFEGKIFQCFLNGGVVGLLWSGLRSLEWGWHEEVMLHLLKFQEKFWKSLFGGVSMFLVGEIILPMFRPEFKPASAAIHGSEWCANSDMVLCSEHLLWIVY